MTAQEQIYIPSALLKSLGIPYRLNEDLLKTGKKVGRTNLIPYLIIAETLKKYSHIQKAEALEKILKQINKSGEASTNHGTFSLRQNCDGIEGKVLALDEGKKGEKIKGKKENYIEYLRSILGTTRSVVINLLRKHPEVETKTGLKEYLHQPATRWHIERNYLALERLEEKPDMKELERYYQEHAASKRRKIKTGARRNLKSIIN